jgi:hypothetical protein
MKRSTEKLLLYGGLAFAAYYLFLRPQASSMGGLHRNYAGTQFGPGWVPKRTSGDAGGLPGLPGLRPHLNYNMSGVHQESVSPYHRSRYLAY